MEGVVTVLVEVQRQPQRADEVLLGQPRLVGAGPGHAGVFRHPRAELVL
jgi:hypothetical protein